MLQQVWTDILERRDFLLQLRLSYCSGVRRNPYKAHLISSTQLSRLPKLGSDNRRRANEAAERGAVGPENNWHVAGKIHRADSIGIVVQIGRVKTGFATVGTGPFRFRPNEPHSRAVGIVVHLPVCLEKAFNESFGKKVRRSMWAVQHANLPGLGHLRQNKNWRRRFCGILQARCG